MLIPADLSLILCGRTACISVVGDPVFRFGPAGCRCLSWCRRWSSRRDDPDWLGQSGFDPFDDAWYLAIAPVGGSRAPIGISRWIASEVES
jgi:hypothetical protein